LPVRSDSGIHPSQVFEYSPQVRSDANHLFNISPVKSSSAFTTSEAAWPGECQSGSLGAPDWKTVLAEAIRDPQELCRELDLPSSLAEHARQAGKGFPLLLPRTVLPRIRKGDPHDPVLRQFLPVWEETQAVEGFTTDPLQEQAALTAPGILAKYHGRILIVTHPACPVHCRYCFRRHFPYAQALAGKQAEKETSTGVQPRLIASVVEYLSTHPDVTEVIFSGGEPLIIDDPEWKAWLKALADIPHLRRVRVHTRMPIVIPQRVTADLLATFERCPLTKVIVLHANHPREIDNPVSDAILRLRATGAVLFVQSVLLAGVNDSPEVLVELYEKLSELGVMPYYLHQLDRVAGAHHFEVPEHRGREIIAELRRRLPGYLVPQYVREVPGATAKVPIF
jgi:EF-P beta-lysylation protein EpmB